MESTALRCLHCCFPYSTKPLASSSHLCRSLGRLTFRRSMEFPGDLVLPFKLQRNCKTFFFQPLKPPVAINCSLVSSGLNSKDGEDEEAKGSTTHCVGMSVAMACVLGAIGLSGRTTCPPALAFQFFPAQERCLSMRSLSLSTLRSGKEALEGLLDAKKARLDPKMLETAESDLQQLLKQENNFDPQELQKVVWKLEMSGKEDKVVKTLQEKFEEESRKHHLDRAYELGLLWVEMLIYQGKYWYARKISNELQLYYMEEEKRATDARPSLYLAATNLMLGDMKAAEEKWKMFTEIQRRVKGEMMGLISSCENIKPEEAEHSITFEQFKEHMEVLKREIDEARK